MSSYPELHELIWLFESDPTLDHDDLSWEFGASFRTQRGAWDVSCAIDVYGYSIEIEVFVDKKRVIHVKLNGDVDVLDVQREGGREVLSVKPRPDHDLREIRLQLKPHVSLITETVHSWERR